MATNPVKGTAHGFFRGIFTALSITALVVAVLFVSPPAIMLVGGLLKSASIAGFGVAMGNTVWSGLAAIGTLTKLGTIVGGIGVAGGVAGAVKGAASSVAHVPSAIPPARSNSALAKNPAPSQQKQPAMQQEQTAPAEYKPSQSLWTARMNAQRPKAPNFVEMEKKVQSGNYADHIKQARPAVQTR